MKRFVSVVAVLLCMTAVPLFAAQPSLVDDVIRMSKAGVADETILAMVQKAGRYDITTDDVIAMTDAGVSKAVIKAVVSESADSRYTDRRRVVYAPYYAPYYGYGYGFYNYYDPFYDPWYPRVYLNFGFRGGFYGGHGGFRHGRR